MLAHCASAPLVTTDRPVDVPTPTLRPISAELSKDCPPSTTVTANGPLLEKSIHERLAAVEEALSDCRRRLRLIRELL